MFEALGLTPTCEVVYLSMFATGTADTAALARHLTMDEARLRAALESLERLSLIGRSAEDPDRVWLTDPGAGLAALQHAEAARRQREVEESRSGLARLWAMHVQQQSAAPDPAVERLPDDSARQALRVLLEAGPREMSVLAPRIDAAGPDPLTDCALIRGAIDRGMRLRVVCLSSVRNDPATVELLRRLQQCGGEMRTAPTLPLQMAVVDSRVALIPVGTDDPGGTTLRVSGSTLLTALLALFNRLWREAAPLGTARPRLAGGLSTRDKAVLRLLGSGHTDEAVARRLGISVRSTRRIVAGLLARLNARSRFQAGVLAASRSWIEPDDLD